MYIYTKENTSVANGMKITALNIDPAYELECIQPVLNGVSGEDGIYYSHQTGRKKYEIKNHLGNVHVLVSDKKVGQDTLPGPTTTNGIIDHNLANVVDASDYYPFGWYIQNRKDPQNAVDEGGYWFGFNGQEKDDEIKGTGNSLAFKYRIHDPRIGRFLSIDPICALFPWNSPYVFSENDVIRAVELEGAEKRIVVNAIGENNKPYMVKDYDLTYLTSQGHGVLGTGTLYLTMQKNKNITSVHYANFANEGKLNEVSGFTSRVMTQDIGLWDYTVKTPLKYTWESGVQVGLKSSNKLKIFGFGTDLSYGVASYFLYANINSDRVNTKGFKEVKATGSWGAGAFGFSGSYSSDGTFGFSGNLSVLKSQIGINPFNKKFSGSTDVTIIDFALVEGVGANFSLKYNGTKAWREFYNNMRLAALVPQKYSWQLNTNSLKYLDLKKKMK